MIERFWRSWQAWRNYPLAAGTVLADRYRIDRFVGMGSYGQAYEGTDLTDNTRVLLKTNKPSKGRTGIRLLRRESDIMHGLRHPQIPAWLGYAVIGRRELLVIALCQGHNLEEWMIERGRVFAEREALQLARELVKPLQYLHASGFVHRDVRTPNVMENGGHISLIDFGLACAIGEELPPDLKKALGDGGSSSGSEPKGPGAAKKAGRKRLEGGRGAPKGRQHLAGARDAAKAAERPEGTWDAVKAHMREPVVDSDLYGLGHFLLFLLYSGYEPFHEEERSWEEELTLSPGTRALIAKLLRRGPGSYREAAEIAADLDALLGRAD
jgi:serine/threonine-protein kinase